MAAYPPAASPTPGRPYRSKDGDTVDLVCWFAYGRKPGVVERVFEANPGFADLPILLPVGTVIDLPAAPSGTRPVLQSLWN